MKYYREYKIKKAIPRHPEGQIIRYDGNRDKYFFTKWDDFFKRWGWELDYDGDSYSLDEIRDGEWFEPTGEPREYIPKFPSKAKIGEYFSLLPDAKLVDDVDECRAINMMVSDKKFQDELYEFYKKSYNKFHKFNGR